MEVLEVVDLTIACIFSFSFFFRLGGATGGSLKGSLNDGKLFEFLVLAITSGSWSAGNSADEEGKDLSSTT